MEVRKKPKCPEASTRRSGDESYTLCDCSDTECMYEHGYPCEPYEEYLAELESDKE